MPCEFLIHGQPFGVLSSNSVKIGQDRKCSHKVEVLDMESTFVTLGFCSFFLKSCNTGY